MLLCQFSAFLIFYQLGLLVLMPLFLNFLNFTQSFRNSIYFHDFLFLISLFDVSVPARMGRKNGKLRWLLHPQVFLSTSACVKFWAVLSSKLLVLYHFYFLLFKLCRKQNVIFLNLIRTLIPQCLLLLNLCSDLRIIFRLLDWMRQSILRTGISKLRDPLRWHPF